MRLAGAWVPPPPGLPARGERRGGGGGSSPGEPRRARGGSVGSLRREGRLRDRDGGPGRDGSGGVRPGGRLIGAKLRRTGDEGFQPPFENRLKT